MATLDESTLAKIARQQREEKQKKAQAKVETNRIPIGTPKLTLAQKQRIRDADPQWSSGAYYTEHGEARRKFVASREILLKRLQTENHSDSQVLTFFEELKDEYQKVVSSNMLQVQDNTVSTPQLENASRTQLIGAQLWLDFLTQALSAFTTSGVPLITYVAHAVNAEKNYDHYKLSNSKEPDVYEWHREKVAVKPPKNVVHDEQLQKMQEFIDTTMTKKNTKSDLMHKYEAALDIIQEQAKEMLEREESEDVATLRATIVEVTRTKRLQRETYQKKIDELTAEIRRLEEGDTSLVKAQEILRMGLLLSISDEFDEAARQFLKEAKGEFIEKATEYNEEEAML